MHRRVRNRDYGALSGANGMRAMPEAIIVPFPDSRLAGDVQRHR